VQSALFVLYECQPVVEHNVHVFRVVQFEIAFAQLECEAVLIRKRHGSVLLDIIKTRVDGWEHILDLVELDEFIEHECIVEGEFSCNLHDLLDSVFTREGAHSVVECFHGLERVFLYNWHYFLFTAKVSSNVLHS